MEDKGWGPRGGESDMVTPQMYPCKSLDDNKCAVLTYQHPRINILDQCSYSQEFECFPGFNCCIAGIGSDGETLDGCQVLTFIPW